MNKQVVDEIAQLDSHELLDALHELPLASLQGRGDQGGESMLARQLHALAGHQVEAAPEDQLRLEMSLGHGGDLSSQQELGLVVDAPVSVGL